MEVGDRIGYKIVDNWESSSLLTDGFVFGKVHSQLPVFGGPEFDSSALLRYITNCQLGI